MSSNVIVHILKCKLFYYELFSCYFSILQLEAYVVVVYTVRKWGLLSVSSISGGKEDVTKYIKGDVRFDGL